MAFLRSVNPRGRERPILGLVLGESGLRDPKSTEA